ncbi:MAG TPA: CHAD domain-containing protein [Gammaproteobacteria bacterium]|nr:CHAD domain-containing protein [Gammaproteobacteria bacterium]
MILSQYRIHEPGNEAAILHREVRIEAAPQHANKAHKLAAHIQKTFSLNGDKQSLLDIALARLGKTAAGYSSKLDLLLQAGLRADAAMRKILLVLLDTMEINEEGTIGDLDTDFLHDFRVAVRRTRTALTQMKSVMAPHTLDRFIEEFAWLGNVTTLTRDLDIYLLKFDKLKKSLPENLRDDLEPLREYLEIRQRQEQAGLANTLRSAAYRKIKEQWRQFLTTELPRTPSGVDAAKPISDVARRKTWRMYRRVLRQGGTITTSSSATDLHELRKSCKKLRYLMEFFQSLYPSKKIRKLIRELKTLQDHLGDFQDLQVQIHTLSVFSEKINRTESMQAQTRLANDALLATLQDSATGVRSEFELCFERFCRKLNRRQFRRLFHPADKREMNVTET